MKKGKVTYVTTQQLCEELQVSKHWVTRRLHKSKNPLPSIKIGKNSYRYPLEKVMDWINAGYAEL